VDAQTAPTGPWKTAAVFHERPPPSSNDEGEQTQNEDADLIEPLSLEANTG
jgi:hypothetical protein